MMTLHCTVRAQGWRRSVRYGAEEGESGVHAYEYVHIYVYPCTRTLALSRTHTHTHAHAQGELQDESVPRLEGLL
jgi:hypothetical protein